MSCLSLKLPPARKVWKNFTCTIGKLRRINKSKAIKKPRKHMKRSILVSSTKRPYKLPPRRFSQKKIPGFRSVFYGFHKKPAPVYIDKLFKEPICDAVKHVKPDVAENPPHERLQSFAMKQRKDSKACTSDDMWESLALASPLMQGINERAEKFIARFRKEMVAQEILARNL
ncbi:uncharacterized protein LOC129287267 [Prosopis cineraria]|uniref:uncharacterized protein LOC129287267 n=1 Tax=Prosopis cineraria TaxID=364024 RepID=UPI00240EF8FB|nr:uncharacterized protein LOC129287267 [Prosopis cineraria]